MHGIEHVVVIIRTGHVVCLEDPGGLWSGALVQILDFREASGASGFRTRKK